MRAVLVSLLSFQLISAQALQVQPVPPPQTPPVPGQASPALQRIELDRTAPPKETAIIPERGSILDFIAPYRLPSAGPLPLSPADRARSYVRDGAIYLSLYEAITLAIENNLDVEVARYNLSIAGTDILRAKGGGEVRGIDYSIGESPTGVGGPGSPLLNSAASSVTPTTPTVNDLTSLNILAETTTDLSVLGPAPFAIGPALPAFQPTFIGQNGWFQRLDIPILASASSGGAGTPGASSYPTLNFITANYALVQGFSYGTQLQVGMTNANSVLYGDHSQYNPFATPNTSVTLSQPLLRGFGRDVNLRYVKIANINQKISRLLFYQQLISTVYGVARLYYDLVSLNENVAVKRETLTAAEKLFEDDKLQEEQGTLAPLGLTQAQALVTSSQLDLIQAQGLVRQQEVILKSQLSRRGSADPVFAELPIIPTSRIIIPASDDLPSINSLVSQALAQRPDLIQASLQVQSEEVALKASQNATRPQLDVVGNFQTRGNTEQPFTIIGTPGTGLVAVPGDLGVAGLRTSHIYQAGIQFNLPLSNHVAQADAARDLLQLRQAQARTQVIANQVREDVENSVIALQTARSALNAAIQSRIYQEQLVDAERDKLSVGASTNFLVIQQESYLAQARSTEVSARSVWIKARVALDRSVGNLLEKNGITYDDSVRAELRLAPRAEPAAQ
ncbi:MAG: TolC family protein [Acidobacteriaceae bacterium]|nr:TolC family protein [Acidobacteriaceae bacterium]